MISYSRRDVPRQKLRSKLEDMRRPMVPNLNILLHIIFKTTPKMHNSIPFHATK
jgi:hypothetical protein